MNQRYVFQGELNCSCGYSAAIREGILHTGNVNTSPYDKPDTTRELYRDLPSLTLSLFEQSYRWLERCISSTASHGKVWLEGYVNAWFFFHNHLSLLNSEDSLIVLDKFPETLAAYKEVIENQGSTCDILYLSLIHIFLRHRVLHTNHNCTQGLHFCHREIRASANQNSHIEDGTEGAAPLNAVTYKTPVTFHIHAFADLQKQRLHSQRD